MKLADKIEVMQKALEGRKIEVRKISSSLCHPGWLPASQLSGDLSWDWHNFEYRVAPESKKLWVTVVDHGPGHNPNYVRYSATVVEGYKPAGFGPDANVQTFEVEFTK